MIDVIPLSAHVGAEVRGVDLSGEINATTKDELYAAWLKHLVLVIRGQNLTADDQRRFTSLFEPLVILVMGIVVGTLILSMLLAIVGMNDVAM